MTTTENLLKKHGLRLTDCRIEVLKVFYENPFAITHSFLEEALDDKHDRVTLYRTLYSFLEKGILHKVPDEAGSVRYALCPEECGHTAVHHHNHIHFKCDLCGHTECLSSVYIPMFEVPDGYKVRELDVLAYGVCKKCSG